MKKKPLENTKKTSKNEGSSESSTLQEKMLSPRGFDDWLILEGTGEPPPNYRKLDVDLNRHCGGGTSYLFLCYKWADENSTGITDLSIKNTGPNNSTPEVPTQYTLVKDQNGNAADLNKGVGESDYIWLSYIKGNGNVIRHIGVSASPTYPPDYPRGDGWTRIDIDLNKNAGGDYINLFVMGGIYDD